MAEAVVSETLRSKLRRLRAGEYLICTTTTGIGCELLATKEPETEDGVIAKSSGDEVKKSKR